MLWPLAGKARRVAREAADWRTEMEAPRSAAQVGEFEAWLRSDPAHLRAYRELDLIADVGSRIPPARSAVPGPMARRRGLASALALAVALVGIGAGSWWLIQERSPAFTAVANHSSAVRIIALGDGSRIVLDTGAAIEVADSPVADTVRMMAGRARFAVDRSGHRPLRVAAGGGTIAATTAVFDIVVQGGEASVSIWKGQVSVAGAANDPTGRPFGAGSALRVAGGRRVVALTAREADWPDARVSFDQAALAGVLARANRAGKPKLVTSDKGVAGLRITGVLDLRDNRALARKLAAALDLTVEVRDDMLLLRR